MIRTNPNPKKIRQMIPGNPNHHLTKKKVLKKTSRSSNRKVHNNQNRNRTPMANLNPTRQIKTPASSARPIRTSRTNRRLATPTIHRKEARQNLKLLKKRVKLHRRATSHRTMNRNPMTPVSNHWRIRTFHASRKRESCPDRKRSNFFSQFETAT